MSIPKPTIIIIHGAWHHPDHYALLVKLLTAKGYETLCPSQPTYNNVPATKSLHDDVALIREILTKLVGDGKEVIVIMHSYGGMIGTEAVTESLSKKSRSSNREKGGVVQLLYMSAFVLHKGQCLAAPLGGELPPFIPVEEDGTCNMLDPKGHFYNDLSPAEAEHWASLLRPCPAISYLMPLTNEAWRYVPSTYLYCENDAALSILVQRDMVEKTGIEVGEVSCSAGHSPFLSMPEKVVEAVEGLKW